MVSEQRQLYGLLEEVTARQETKKQKKKKIV
jgi:hypothetical protein